MGVNMINVTINGEKLIFETTDGVFSPHCVDRGTLAMINDVEFTSTDKLLDLGCGYGAVGIYAAKIIGAQNVVMCDVDNLCVELSERNAAMNGVGAIRVIRSCGFEDIYDADFTLILSNPPYHADFSVPKHFIEKGFNRLKIGGKMYMVTKRRDWYKNKFIAVFGGVKITERDGYFVFCAEKRGARYAGAKRKK